MSRTNMVQVLREFLKDATGKCATISIKWVNEKQMLPQSTVGQAFTRALGEALQGMGHLSRARNMKRSHPGEEEWVSGEGGNTYKGPVAGERLVWWAKDNSSVGQT